MVFLNSSDVFLFHSPTLWNALVWGVGVGLVGLFFASSAHLSPTDMKVDLRKDGENVAMRWRDKKCLVEGNGKVF